MPAPTLVSSCMKVCIKNVRTIKDIGSFEYQQIKPLLQRIESPEQLHIIETNCPQIKGEDAELWQKFIARDIPTWHQKKYVPKNPTKWYEIYCKYRKEQKLEIARDQEILRETMSGLKKKREENTSKIMDLKALPKVPRDPGMRSHNGGVPLGKNNKAGGKVAPSTLNWTSGSKTKMVDGKSVLTRARREAKEISQMGKLSRPTQELRGRAGQVSRAPAGMVKEYKTAAQPQHIRIPSRKPNGVSNRDPGQASTRQGFLESDLEEREERLRRAMGTSGNARSKRDTEGQFKQTVVAFSDDGSEDTGLDDIFDEPPSPPDHGVKTVRTAMPSRNAPPNSKASPASSSAARKPSDIISSMISGRPQQRPLSSPRAAPNSQTVGGPSRPSSRLPSSPTAPAQSQSPQPTGRVMMLPKRKPVDVFHRKPKKPRVT